ncbi:MAG: helicase-related protein [Spirochaetota bacterium]
MVNRHGPDTVSVIFTESTGGVGRQLLSRADQERLFVETVALLPPLDADANEFKLAAESQRIRLAWLHDPLLAVNTSAVEPLPHQISAVYEHMLPRQPLRYLLADDPGAGKTIMAGLLVKELILRGDVERCLIVVPGNLAEQWQDELAEKFQLIFEIMTNDKLAAAVSGNWLSEHDLVIARLDKLSRDEELRPRLTETEWDMIVFDEAHKLSASRFGNDIKYTKRFLLAQELSAITRHLLLMTATPHNGKEEDFQLFLSLIDGDRFEGRPRDGARPVDCSDLMRRLIKEQLVRFDGSPLFPARRAYTVAYALSEGEAELYEEVTRYVREEFNRAERLDEQRRGTVGFALTVLQRRLASSPAAIHSSLTRRKGRLQAQLREQELFQRGERVRAANEQSQWLSQEELEDLEDAPDMEVEDAEEAMMLRASTAQTIEELKAEIATLSRLEALALAVAQGGQDRKWHELSRIIQEEDLMYDANGARRKLVIFTEHRDTLTYLTAKISTMIGNPSAVVTIAGGMAREARRAAEAQFKHDPQTHVLVATDAAGEGINLQRAHLMINYDLPWNPNRLEQRFGRIHRIGQTEVCHLWNLVAHETREGQVFQRLFDKLRVESAALGGRVFDILGSLFEGQALRDLLIRAIRAGADGAQGDFSQVLGDLDRTVDHEHLRELMEETALAFNTLESSTVQKIREQMERARLRRLQPYFIEAYFCEAFANLGGAMRLREKHRWEIRNVPVELRRRGRTIGTGAPLLPRYERITFHHDQTTPIQGRGADLVGPGHPLLSTVLDLTLERYRSHLRAGTILVDRADGDDARPRAMVVLEHAILEGFAGAERRRVASSRLLTVWIYPDGEVAPAGEAPWLDLDTPREDELAAARTLVRNEWSATDLEATAVSHAASNLAPEHLREVGTRRSHQVEKTRTQVRERLSREIAWWDHRAEELRIQEKSGKTNNRINADNARRKRDELHLRLAERLRDLDNQATLSSQVPVILSVAMVVPQVALVREDESGEEPTPFESVDAAARKRIERIAMEAVMAEETRRGNTPVDVSAENRGYDIESRTPDGRLLFLEVKGRMSRADTVTVTQSEMRYGFNHPRQFALVVVLVNPDDTIDGPHYVFDPFDREPGWAECDASLWVSRLIERKNHA